MTQQRLQMRCMLQMSNTPGAAACALTVDIEAHGLCRAPELEHPLGGHQVRAIAC